jgi:hypothetical protein
MSRPYSEHAVAPITHADHAPKRNQVIGVMVRLSVPEDTIPEDWVRDVKHSVQFGRAEVSLAFICPPPVIEPD